MAVSGIRICDCTRDCQGAGPTWPGKGSGPGPRGRWSPVTAVGSTGMQQRREAGGLGRSGCGSGGRQPQLVGELCTDLEHLQCHSGQARRHVCVCVCVCACACVCVCVCVCVCRMPRLPLIRSGKNIDILEFEASIRGHYPWTWDFPLVCNYKLIQIQIRTQIQNQIHVGSHIDLPRMRIYCR